MIGSGRRANLRAPRAAPPRITRSDTANDAGRAGRTRRRALSVPARSVMGRLRSRLLRRSPVAMSIERGPTPRLAGLNGAGRTRTRGPATEVDASSTGERSRLGDATAAAAGSTSERSVGRSAAPTSSAAEPPWIRARGIGEPDGASSTAGDEVAAASSSPAADTGTTSGGLDVSGAAGAAAGGSGAADGGAGCSAPGGGGDAGGDGVDAGGAAGAGGGLGAPRGGSSPSGST
jgi:hypothetical protein